MLMNYCDLAMEHNDMPAAGAVWQAMRRRGLLPFASDQILTNGDFRTAPSGRGFDWRTPTPALTTPFSPGSFTFKLDGFQHEREILLEQPLALDSSRKYQLTFEYKTTGFEGASGLHWIAGPDQNDVPASSTWTSGKLDFAGSTRSLMFIYQRQPGSTLSEGTIAIRNVGVLQK
jgi:hypothetical protein